MPWIQNVALADVRKANHFDPGLNSMLIQIVDPGMEFPTPMYPFAQIHQFEFLDIEEDGMSNDGTGRMIDMSEFAITRAQANDLVGLFKTALDRRMSVVVHCVSGVCRSGAVAEVGIMLGFDDTETYRSPNLLVKHKMMKALGWNYDPDEPHTVSHLWGRDPTEFEEF